MARVLRDLEVDPYQPRLHLHPLSGRMKGISAVNVTHSYRITLILAVSLQQITLLKIGSHDEV